MAHGHCGDTDTSLSLFLQAVSIRLLVTGEAQLGVADVYFHMSQVYCVQQKFTQAIDLLEQSLNIRIEFLGSRSYKVHNIYSSMAYVYFMLDQYNDALAYYNICIDLFEICFQDVKKDRTILAGIPLKQRMAKCIIGKGMVLVS